jgi:hypothetical protein
MSERFGSDLLLIEKLAAGGMAEVHRAKQLGYGGFEKWVAVKRILPNFASNEEFKAMFRMEANLSGMLQHPNIVHVFGNGEFGGYLYLVMEFVDGRNLRQVLARADKKKIKIPIEIACHVVAEAAKGLEYAHNFIDEKTGQPMEVVHRDMSPQNVMVSYDGNVKVVDFGIAKAASRAENTRAGVLKGKFGYMSPEQASGMKIDRRTDIFALGIILFETLTQRRLFTCDDDLRTLHLVKECRVPRPSKYNPGIGPGLDRIVMKALAKERSERYATAAELYADLLRFMNQKYPKFLPMEMAGFLRKLFLEEMTEERKKREKWAADAPAREVAPVRGAANSDDGERTNVDSGVEAKTQVSQVRPLSEFAAPPVEEAASVGVDLPDASLGEGDFVSSPEDATQLTGSIANGELPMPGDSPGSMDPRSAFPSSAGPSNLSLSVPTLPRASNEALGAGDRTVLRLSVGNVPSDSRPTQLSSAGARPTSPARRKRLYLYAGAGLVLFLIVAVSGMQTPVGSGSSQVVATQPDNSPPAVAEVEQPATPAPAEVAPVDPAPVAPAPIAEAEPAPVAPTSVVPAPVAPPQQVVQESAAPPTPVRTEPQQRPDVREPAAIDPGFNRPTQGALAGYLNLSSTPRATEIYLDGKLLLGAKGQPLQTPLMRHTLPPGRHTIELRNSVFGVRHSEVIEISPDRILSRDVVLSGGLK